MRHAFAAGLLVLSIVAAQPAFEPLQPDLFSAGGALVNDMPVHAGVAGERRVDVEVTVAGAGRRPITRLRGIDVRSPQVLVTRTR